MNTLIIIGIVAVALSIWIGWSYKRMKKAPPVANHPNVKTLTQNNFKQMTANGLILVDFWAPWCGPCKQFAPTYTQMAGQYVGRVRFAHADASGGSTHTWKMVVYDTLLPRLADRFDLALVLEDMIAKGLAQPENGVQGVELITEVSGGKGEVWLNRFSVAVN